ncbi:MAG: DUF3426 domain-containing protein [Desulfatiglandales bacterium]
MIVVCEKCESKFKLEESLLKKEGSRVRCSLCRHVFTAYPSESLSPGEAVPYDDLDEGLQETVPLDSPPGSEAQEDVFQEPEDGPDLGDSFEETMEGVLAKEISYDRVPEGDRSLSAEMSEGPNGFVGESPGEEEEIETSTGTEGGGAAEIPSSTREKPSRSRVLPVMLLIIVVLILVGLGVSFLKPELIPDRFNFLKPAARQEITDIGVSRLTLKAVKGDFVESKVAGRIFVIRGMITNDYPQPRSLISIRGSLMDTKQELVKESLVYAGNSLTDQELQDMDMGRINEALSNKSGKDEMNVNVRPGSSIPIMVVFDNLPENLSEFTVEAVSSAPGE